MPEPTTEQWEQIQAELFAGRKIQAIKLYRVATACGLADAKEAMEAYAAKLHQQAPERFTKDPAKTGCAGMILLFLLVAAAGVVNLSFS
jgi:ribosomal protein L7/L12